MKNMICLVVTLLLVSGSAYSQRPPVGYIGLFTDDTHSAWCVDGVGFYPTSMWILCMPSYLGQTCAEFRVCYPTNVIQSTITWNYPIISVTLGDLPSGLSVCYNVCQWDWHWIAHQLLYVTDPTQTHIEICSHPDIGVYQFANCEPGYCIEPCIKLTDFYLNIDPYSWECTVGTEESSWGAIKSMFSE